MCWNGLLNDADFVNFIEKNNIKVYFYPHINMQMFLSDFESDSKNIEIVSPNEDIQKYLNKCSLMVTDYSSVAFDFAYLDKPVIYFQFDLNDFRRKQYPESSYKYNRDGFGPVVRTYPAILKSIKTIFDSKDRVTNTFDTKCDNRNSERLYNVLAEKRSKIKVIHVVNSMNIGGVETFLLNLYNNIDRSKIDFVFLTNKSGRYDYQDEIEKNGGRFIKIDSPSKGRRLKHLIQLNDVLKIEKPDVVHCHTYFDAVSVMLVARFRKVPIRITHSHTTEGFNLRHKNIR